jgi:integrase
VLHRRGNTYTSRIVVPRDVRAFLRRSEITRSLRTTDAREAARRCALWEPHVHALFNRARKHGRSMTREELDVLTRRYLAEQFDAVEERLSADWERSGWEEWSFQLNERCHDLSDSLKSANVRSTLAAARELAPNADAPTQRILARRMIEAQLRACMAELDAMSGEPLVRPTDANASVAPFPENKATPRISEVAARYAEERKARGTWRAKTAHQAETIFALIAELLSDPPVGTVTKDALRVLGLNIVKLPKNMTKRFPGMAALDVLAATENDSAFARLEARSINKVYQHARSLFSWAAEHDFIEQNPASVLHDVAEGRVQDARKAFDDNDIRALFRFIEGVKKEPYGLWIPRIMAFAGCRMGEAAQLRKVDVRQEQGVWVFDFNDDAAEKTLKTEGSARLVPVHSRLLDLGLVEFVQSCDSDYLFPERIRRTPSAIRGDVDRLSKQLSRWLRRAGVDDPKKQFQSFRGTFATRLKNVGVHEHHIAELMGHENDNITTGRYGKKSNLCALRDAVERLELPI